MGTRQSPQVRGFVTAGHSGAMVAFLAVAATVAAAAARGEHTPAVGSFASLGERPAIRAMAAVVAAMARELAGEDHANFFSSAWGALVTGESHATGAVLFPPMSERVHLPHTETLSEQVLDLPPPLG